MEYLSPHELDGGHTEIVGLGLDPVRVSKIAGHSNVSVTLNIYAEEFDKAMHHDDLMARIERAGFGSV